MTAHRAEMVHLTGDPARDPAAAEHVPDGLLVVRDGLIDALGPYDELRPRLPPSAALVEHPGGLITPGFIDCHVHFPQLDVIASHGPQLLDWLERYTFPAEARFADPAHARETADLFLAELLRNGTTCALVFSTVHTAATAALFEAAAARGMRLAAGKTFMDRGAPAALCEPVEAARAGALALIDAWHGAGRLSYAVTPRFAPTCSAEMLAMAGRLVRERPDLHVHSHLSENPAEIALVAELFPAAGDYLGVYEAHGLVTDRAVFAHAVHLDRAGFARLAGAGASVAHCPTSNLFLGSGLFDLALADETGTAVGLGTDVGAGTSFSLFATMEEAYKVAQLRGAALSPWRAFYLATLGGARALRMDDKVGDLSPGKEADFLVLDRAATPLIARRLSHCNTIEEQLFALAILGDDRVVSKTYVAGALAHDRAAAPASQLR
ncbi:MAG: guanine deaminase [Caulobacterales bacterium]|nr:guanine deaminase [Caulobacterales bacterium]